MSVNMVGEMQDACQIKLIVCTLLGKVGQSIVLNNLILYKR